MSTNEVVTKIFVYQVLFVTINTDEEDHVRILEFFGMKKDEIPSMRAIKLEDDMAKYKPEVAELTEESIQKFVSDFVEGKLKVYIDEFLLLNAHDSVYVFLIADCR